MPVTGSTRRTRRPVSTLDDSQSFLEEINPGNTVKGVVVFDVPKKFEAAKAELHDSMFSGGVEIALT